MAPAEQSSEDPILELVCLIEGDNKPFKVKIAANKWVFNLQKIIHEKGVDVAQRPTLLAKNLSLLKVDIDLDGQTKESLRQLATTEDGNWMSEWKRVSEFWKEQPDSRRLHILVKLPTTPVVRCPPQPIEELPYLERQHAISVQWGKDAPAPSSAAQAPAFKREQEKRPITNGRPMENHGLPVQVFHPAFSHFQHVLSDPNISLTADDYTRAHGYMSASAAIYNTEEQRRRAISTCLNEATRIHSLRVSNQDGTSPDGTFVVATADGHMARAGIYKLKNEIGAGHSDPAIQASLLYMKACVSDELAPIRRSCCCPSFILAIAGPWMCILGAVFTGTIVVKQLTDYVWTGGDPHDDKALESVARLFKALYVGLQELQEFYGSMITTPKSNYQRLFPFTRSYIDSHGQEVNFEYLGRLNDTKAIYSAKDTSGRLLIVKFAQRYNSRAHRLLASHGLAPQLHYSSLDNTNSKKMGALGVVIMDFVQGSDAHKLYSKTQLPNTIHGEVKRAIDILHTESIVFGDLRLPNIIITKQNTPMLVDFDWCGTHGVDRYPPTLNDWSSIGWHEGVVRNGVMYMEHDTFMLRALQPDHSMDWSG